MNITLSHRVFTKNQIKKAFTAWGAILDTKKKNVLNASYYLVLNYTENTSIGKNGKLFLVLQGNSDSGKYNTDGVNRKPPLFL